MQYDLDAIPPFLRGFVFWSLRIKSFLISIFALVMGLTFFVVVILRYGMEADLFAYEEWLLVICFWLYFLASAVGTFEKVHINADLLSYAIKDPRIAFVRSITVYLVELAILSVLIWWSVLMVLDELSFYPNLQATSALRIPMLVPRLAMLVGFAFMAFYTILHIYVEVKTRRAVGPIGPDSPPPIP